MKYTKELKDLLFNKEYKGDYSKEATDKVEEILNELEDRVSKEEHFYYCDLVHDVLDGQFSYYSDAFNYLQSNGFYDYSEAIADGSSCITGFANYYFYEEVIDLLNELDFYG